MTAPHHPSGHPLTITIAALAIAACETIHRIPRDGAAVDAG